MVTTYQKYLTDVSVKVGKHGEKLQSPCRQDVIARVRQHGLARFGKPVPQGYLAFLKQHNGFDWNGLTIFAGETVPIVGYTDRHIAGFLEANADYREQEGMERFMVFGEDGEDLYVFDMSTGRFGARDRVSLDVNEEFSSFDDMLAGALKRVV